MTGGRSYGSPGALRRALTGKLRNLAAASRWTLRQLQRQMAYDRLLERLYLDDEGWIIKGATALHARDMGQRRPATGTSSTSWPSSLLNSYLAVALSDGAPGSQPGGDVDRSPDALAGRIEPCGRRGEEIIQSAPA